MTHFLEEAEEEIYYHLHDHACEFDVGCDHNDEDSHNHRGSEKKRLLLAATLTAAMMIVEVFGGFFSNSLALISDAGHMLTHLLALSISLLALIFSTRPPTERRTFGFYRLEILAALFNGIILFLITIWIFIEAYHDFLHPKPIASMQMFIVAVIGLIVNIITAIILSKSGHSGINIRSAFLHMIGDTLSSVGVVIGAIIIYFTDWVIIDPLLSVVICVAILIWSYKLIMESVDILLEAIPKDIETPEVIEAIKVISEVKEVHDLHIWTLTSSLYALSAHVVINNIAIEDTSHLLKRINFILCKKFRIGHTAIQFECATPLIKGG